MDNCASLWRWVGNLPKCLMHSEDPRKDLGAFESKFEQILEKAGDAAADFRGFVFPRAAYKGRRFAARCSFKHATFLGGADFSGSVFAQDVDFRQARFVDGCANFYKAQFSQQANFAEAIFGDGANGAVADFWESCVCPRGVRQIGKFSQTARSLFGDNLQR